MGDLTREKVATRLHKMANELSQSLDPHIAAFVDDLAAATLFLRSDDRARNEAFQEAARRIEQGHGSRNTVYDKSRRDAAAIVRALIKEDTPPRAGLSARSSAVPTDGKQDEPSRAELLLRQI